MCAATELHQADETNASSSSTASTEVGSMPTTVLKTDGAVSREASTTSGTIFETTIFDSYMLAHPSAVVIGIHGKWYDVTSFRYRHPGGSLLLEKFHGKDATDLYDAFHRGSSSGLLLKFWRPIGDCTANPRNALLRAHFGAVRHRMQEAGLFQTSFEWYARKIAVVFILLAISIGCILWRPAGDIISLKQAIVAGVFLGLFWQQCGYLTHDAMHSGITQKRNVDRWIGFIFGSLCLGINSHWWRDEHFEHHAMTNVIESPSIYADPQMLEDVWFQDEDLFVVTKRLSRPQLFLLRKVLVRFQTWLWILIAFAIGRFGIVAVGLSRGRYWYEVVAFLTHNVLIGAFMHRHFGLRGAFAYWYSAALMEGILHVQLLVNHYPRPWTELAELCELQPWQDLQTRNTLNISCPVWMDWFFGGLNYHIEHHLFPKLPRHNLRAAKKYVQQACLETGLPYDETSFLGSIWLTCRKMNQVSLNYAKYVAKHSRYTM